MRVVLDTNILVRAAGGSRGPAKEVLQYVVSSPQRVLILSPFLLAELERVASYPRVRAATKLNAEEMAAYLAYLISPMVSEIVSSTAAPHIVPADPDDDEVVHTAVVGRADWLCTLNRYFYQPPLLGYCNQHRIRIGTDLDLLRILRTLL